MQIEWLGATCFRIQTKQALIIIDPGVDVNPNGGVFDLLVLSGLSGFKSSLVKLSSTSFTVNTPGEFESQSVFVHGFESPQVEESTSQESSIWYRLRAEGLKIGHLAGYNSSLSSKVAQSWQGLDILLVPISGQGQVELATQLVKQLEPRIVIPMAYQPAATPIVSELKAFAVELGVAEVEVNSKLNIKAKNLPLEGPQLVVLG